MRVFASSCSSSHSRRYGGGGRTSMQAEKEWCAWSESVFALHDQRPILLLRHWLSRRKNGICRYNRDPSSRVCQVLHIPNGPDVSRDGIGREYRKRWRVCVKCRVGNETKRSTTYLGVFFKLKNRSSGKHLSVRQPNRVVVDALLRGDGKKTQIWRSGDWMRALSSAVAVVVAVVVAAKPLQDFPRCTFSENGQHRDGVQIWVSAGSQMGSRLYTRDEKRRRSGLKMIAQSVGYGGCARCLAD
ncbi:hypothetical protein B0T14DRAFT_137272 [Immersiella caudata]|uniref:Uncharacterized protein n=1 Tax=Immersiella caudata TaxID=314043 RepID=A0AA39X643_9PEZI|nr:hypothetical protein B0T14DRAFT_137272 [Immersiella caudata]